jgi:PAS domain S-box-containing protein
MLYVAGGTFALLSYASRATWPGLLPRVLAVLGGLPLIGAGVVSAVWAHVWLASAMAAALGLGVVVDAFRQTERPAEGPRQVPSVAVLAAMLAAANAAAALGRPGLLRLPATLAMIRFLPHVGVGLAGAAAVLVVGWAVPRFRPASQVVAALPLLAFAAVFAPVGRLASVLTYGLLGIALALEPVLHGLMQQRINQRRLQARSATEYEFATEVASWGFVFLVALIGSAEAAGTRRPALAVLAMVTSLFTFTWFHLLPVRGSGSSRVVVGNTIASVLCAILVEITGGLSSFYFFTYFLPILGLAWTQKPQTIVIPLAIPVAALLVEAAIRLQTGGLSIVVFVALPRLAGLVLVSGLSYMLALRNLAVQHRIGETNRRLEAIVSHMGEGLITTDSVGRVTLCNPTAQMLLGQDGDPRQKMFSDVLTLRAADGSPLEASMHPVRQALGGRPVPWERYVVQGTGGSRSIAVTATPLLDARDRGGAIILLRDINTEVEMERMRDDFFFIASHELRTPLTVMKGNLEMAQELAPAGSLRITLEEALRSVMRLIRMVNAFLDAASLEHGAISLHIEDAHLPDLVQQAVETLRPDAERKGLVVAYRPMPGLPAVRADVERTVQVLLNIIGNSVRYTESGQIDIWHEVRGGTVETLVRDTGVGIAPEQQDRLFTRFGQVERGLTRTSGGSGLGLYISRKLAEEMNGTVVLKQSAPGRGSTFALVLPAAVAAGAGL